MESSRLRAIEKALSGDVQVLTKDGANEFRSSVFRDVLGALKKFSQISFGEARSEKGSTLGETANVIDTKIFKDELRRSAKTSSGFKKNLDKMSESVNKTFSVLGRNENSRSAKMRKVLVWTIAGVRRMDMSGITGLAALWKRGGAAKIGAITAFGAVSAFKVG